MTYGGSGYWKQRYMVKMNTSEGESADHYISPVQYNDKSFGYAAYHPETWWDENNDGVFDPDKTKKPLASKIGKTIELSKYTSEKIEPVKPVEPVVVKPPKTGKPPEKVTKLEPKDKKDFPLWKIISPIIPSENPDEYGNWLGPEGVISELIVFIVSEKGVEESEGIKLPEPKPTRFLYLLLADH